jgi:hypothetical protein
MKTVWHDFHGNPLSQKLKREKRPTSGSSSTLGAFYARRQRRMRWSSKIDRESGKPEGWVRVR